jgi:hypothetical protein
MPDTVSLKEHFDSWITGHDRRHDELESHRLELRDLLQRALDGVAESLKEYKTSSNEWRGTLNDVIAGRPDRNELIAVQDKFNASLGTLQRTVDELRSANLLQTGAKERGVDMRTAVLGFGGLIVVIASVVIAAVVAFT